MNTVSNHEDVYKIKTTRKISALGICRFLFFGCFFLAIFIANTVWQNEAAWIGYLHESCFLELPETLSDGSGNLMIVILSRFPFWISIVLFGPTLAGVMIAQIYSTWQGFALGFLLASFLMRYGVVGVAVFGCMCFPQILLYLIAYVILYHIVFRLHQKRRMTGDMHEEPELAGQRRRAYVMLCILLTTVFVTGMVLESYVNYFFLSQIPNLFSAFH